MAYSRWGISHWYIFWSTSCKYRELREVHGSCQDLETLEVWHAAGIMKNYTYAELQANKGKIDEDFPGIDCSEAKECIAEFIADVSDYYSESP